MCEIFMLSYVYVYPLHNYIQTRILLNIYSILYTYIYNIINEKLTIEHSGDCKQDTSSVVNWNEIKTKNKKTIREEKLIKYFIYFLCYNIILLYV